MGGFCLSPRVMVLSLNTGIPGHELQGGHGVGTVAGLSQPKGTHHVAQRGVSCAGDVVQELSGRGLLAGAGK